MSVATTLWVPGAVPAVYKPVALTTPTVPFPPATPSTAQLAVPPPGTVAVNCCVCDSGMEAIRGETVIAPLAMATVTDATALVPPGPEQASE